MSAVAAALGGGLAGWRGLPDRFDEAALREQVAADWRFDAAAGARIGRSFGILRADSAGGAQDVEAWIPTGDTSISSLEFRPGPGVDHAAILHDLGEPELVLPTSRYAAGALVRDHVHAARGITLAVAEPFGGEPPSIVFVQLYAAGTTTTYVTRVGQSGDEIRPYPV